MFNTLTRLGASGAAPAYEIGNSIRFLASDSNYMVRTPSSGGNQRTFTFSWWHKMGKNAGGENVFVVGANSITDGFFELAMMSWGMRVRWNDGGGGSNGGYHRTIADWDDPSAWYHCVCAVDTTQSTADDRIKFYINGVHHTGSAMIDNIGNHVPDQNHDFLVNTTGQHAIGYGRASGGGIDGYLDGLLSEFHFIDGTQCAATAFGEFNSTTGQWVPIEYEGSYGTNGYYLKFADNSSTAALGTDSSGNGHTWTTSGFSVTAGKDDDAFVDSPTNNFCTLNPIDRSLVGTISNSNLRVSYNYKPATKNFRGTMALPKTGKFYWEWENEEASSNPGRWQTGLVRYTDEAGILDSDGNNDNNYFTVSYGGSMWNGATHINPSWGSNPTFYSGERVAIAIDCDTGKAFVGKVASDGSTTWYDDDGTTDGNPAAGTNETCTIVNFSTDRWMPVIIWHDGGAPVSTTFTSNINFGQHSFLGTPPAGFNTLSSKNLPAPSLTDGSAYFKTVLYTGNGSDGRTVSGVGFDPDLVWIKNRSSNNWHTIQDTVTGITWNGATNSRDAYGNNSNVKTTNSDGFTLGTHNVVNGNTLTYVAWNWLESATAGFDIVTYEGTGANRTVSHGLGVTPQMIIGKNIDQDNQEWGIYHEDLGATKAMFLDDDSAGNTNSIFFNNTAPTSSVFTVGTADTMNGDGDTCIAYLFSSVDGYSKVGFYTGNGNNDGTFVYCGFKPIWLLIKRANSTGPWYLFDTVRKTYNMNRTMLYANIPNAEEVMTDATNPQLDVLSNGFKCRGSHSGFNGSSDTHIFLAFAESPFKYSNGS